MAAIALIISAATCGTMALPAALSAAFLHPLGRTNPLESPSSKVQSRVAAEGQKAQKKAELNQVARKVGADMTSYMAAHPRPQGSIDVSVHESRVILRKMTTSNTVEIVCVSKDTFQVTVEGQAYGTSNQGGMARAVIGWLQR